MIKGFIHIVSLAFCTFCISATALAMPDLEGIQVYQKNIHSSLERKQKLAEDINHYHHANDLWQVLRDNFSLEHYEDDPAVQEQIQWFMNHQDFLLRSANRAAPYLYYILQQSKLRHLPAELALIPIFESAYNPYAYSSQGASGIWQMMPGTAHAYGIQQDWWYDGRRDVIASTKAALSHLSYLKSFFDGNWILAIAAYDSGEGTVQNAIGRNIRDGKSTDFWSLPLPQETRIYVPRLFALAAIIANPDKYPIYLPPVRNAPYLAQIDLGQQIDLHHVASLAGMSFKSLSTLNPGFNRNAASPHGPYKIVLPIENVEEFTENLALLPESDRLAWNRYVTRPHDTVGILATRYNVSPTAIREMNQLSSNSLRPGKELLVPRSTPAISQAILEADHQHYFSAENTAMTNGSRSKRNLHAALRSVTMPKLIHEARLKNNYQPYVIQPGDTIYMTRRGDTLDSVAHHFHLNKQAMLAVNPYRANQRLHSGEKLVVPTHMKKQVAMAGKKAHYLEPGDTIYEVRKGDTVEKIAYKFHTQPAVIRVINLIREEHLHEGDRLVIPARV